MNYENNDSSFPDQPVVDLYLPTRARLPAFKSKPAFILFKDDHLTTLLTFSQLNDSVHSLSSKLINILRQQGETIIVLWSPKLELVEIISACQRSGLLCVLILPFNPSFSKENHHYLTRVLSQTKPKAAIANRNYITKVYRYINLANDTKLAHMLQNLTWISTEDVKTEIVNSKFDYSSYNGRKADELYLIQYTSGATGIPKPILITVGSAAHNAKTARKAYDLHPNSMIVSWLPQYHDCGFMLLLLTIVFGVTYVLTSPIAFVHRPRLWLKMISKFKATCTLIPSFALPLVLKHGGGFEKGTSDINLHNLRNLIIINEPIYKSTVDNFLEVFRPFGLNPSSISRSCGLAETYTFVSTSWRSLGNYNKKGSSNFPNFPCHSKLLPSARLGSGNGVDHENEDMEIVIVNEETLELVEDGIEGEILVSSPSNVSIYLVHPSLTLEVFHQRLLLSKRANQPFVQTNDRGVVKGEKRFLFVMGQ